jgi:hypothetical protein
MSNLNNNNNRPVQTGRSLQDILNKCECNSHRGNSHRGNSHRGNSHRGNSYRGNSHRGSKSSIHEQIGKETIRPELNVTNFPELILKNNTSYETNDTISLDNLDFKKVVDLLDHDETTDYNENVEKRCWKKPGWTIIDKRTRKITTYDIYGRVIVNGSQNNAINLSSQDIYNVYNSKRWSKYYDDTNELLGDRSPYFNYKHTIDTIVREDDERFKKIYNEIINYSSGEDERGDN